MATLNIRAIVQGYQGKMVCVVAAMDEASGLILVVRADDFDEEMDFPTELTILTNVSLLPTWTMFFKEEQLRDAIEAYHALSAHGLIELDSPVQRYDPVSMIQFNGIKEGGVEYRFSESMGNGHVAVLVCALFAEKQRKIRASLAAQEQSVRAWPYENKQNHVIAPMSVGYFI